MKFCVIGAGSGGRAFAAYLSSKGYPVSLYNRSFTRIYEIQKEGGIEANGELEGFFPLDLVTLDIKIAVKDADVIMVVTPASAHGDVAKHVAPHLKRGQIIILNPGRTFGSVEFLRVVEKERGKLSIFVGEMQTLLFTCRALEGNEVNIIKIKDSVKFSTFPNKHVSLIYERIKEVFPQLVPVDDYLEVTLNNIGMLLHPAISLMNAGMMDFGKKFKFYKEGATSKVCQVLENVELELNEIFQKLGLRQSKYHEWAKKSYDVNAMSIYDAIQKVDAYKDVNAPDQLITRYFTEDVPTGLVPISSLGAFFEVQTPTIESIICLSSILCGINFKKTGRTLQKLQLNDYILTRLKRAKLLEEEKRGYYSIGKILINQDDFKICCHCNCMNSSEKNSCWLCNHQDFRKIHEADLLTLRQKKLDSLMRT